MISIPNGLFLSLNFEFKEPRIFPLPHPISKILDLELSVTCFNKKLLHDLM